MRVLHVTECLATGVLDVIARMSAHLLAQGCEVTVLHVPHPETPTPSDLAAAMPGVRIVEARGAGKTRLSRVLGLRFALARVVRAQSWDVVHLHSTFAGFIGRVPWVPHLPVVYSPHGFAFLRGDVSPRLASLYRRIEFHLAPGADVIHCVSSDEACVAEQELGARAVLLRNVLGAGQSMHRDAPVSPDRPRVVNIGRWTQQKAPERFARAARELHQLAEFRWIGTGESDPTGRWQVTGWLDQPALSEELASASLVYFTSRWEGMPVGLMQAQAAGVPAIAIGCVGVADVVIDGVTGHVARTEEEALALLRQVLGSPAKLGALTLSTRARADRFEDENYGRNLLEVYELARSARSGR